MEKYDIKTMDIGTVVKNLSIMLHNMSKDPLRNNRSVRHYVGLNYQQHLERLKDDYLFDTAYYYTKQWGEVTGRELLTDKPYTKE